MKKAIIGLCILVTGCILFVIQNEFNGNVTTNNIDELFAGQIFDEASEKYTVHAMGVGQEEKVLTVRIEKAQYKEQVVEYFSDILDSYNLKSYKLEVFADNSTN